MPTVRRRFAYRLRGKALLTLGRKGEAEADLQRALTIAQQQRARWWELRAATSLAKYWHDEGKYPEAYSLLRRSTPGSSRVSTQHL
jgi:tetratricopeptide (TPR) repeat protein